MKVGYALLTNNQHYNSDQVNQLKAAGCSWIFQEASSKGTTEQNRMLESLKPGDAVVVGRLTHLGDTKEHLVRLLITLNAKRIGLFSIAEHLEIPADRMEFALLIITSVSFFEKENMSFRTKARLKQAKSKGVVLGKPAGLSESSQKKANEANRLYKQGKTSVSEICRQLLIGRSTFYRYIKL